MRLNENTWSHIAESRIAATFRMGVPGGPGYSKIRLVTPSSHRQRSFKEFEAEGWQQRAVGYDAFFGPIAGRVIAPLLDAVEAEPGARLLDVATGPGHVAAAAHERGAAVVGIDLAEAMVALAKANHPELMFRKGDAEALDIPDGIIDAVTGNFIMLHLENPERAMAEVVRVLAPGGRVAVTV